MKIFALILSIFVLIASAVALKNDVCGLDDSVAGRCRMNIPSWSYRANTNECVQFIYGGCEGNANRFETAAQCEETCKE